jgi:hypothetical protein
MQFRHHLLLGGLWMANLAMNASADDSSPAVVRVALSTHRAACTSLRMSYVTTRGPAWAVDQDGGRKAVRVLPPIRYEWWMSRSRERLTHDFLPREGEIPARSPQWVSWDGAKSYKRRYWLMNPDVPESVEIRPEKPEDLDYCPPLTALGWKLSIDQPTLESVLALPGVQDLGEEAIDDVPYRKYEVSGITREGVSIGFMRVWLSAAHGWLPRRWLILPERYRGELPSGTKMTLEPGEVAMQADIEAFMELPDERTAQRRWFPRVIVINGDRTELDAANVAWNPTLDPQSFVPQAESGVMIAEWKQGAIRKTIVGGQAGAERYAMYFQQNRTDKDLLESSAEPGTQAAAATPPISSTIRWLRYAGLMFLLCSGILAIRRWRSGDELGDAS